MTVDMLPQFHKMRVDAREVIRQQSSIAPDKASIGIAIVATLVSIALFSCLLRVYTHGRLLRTFAFDDGLALVAALCCIGVLVTFVGLVRTGVEDRQWEAASSDSGSTGPWTLALSLLHVIGISMTKLSASFYLLRIFDRRYCCYMLNGLIALALPSAITWFGSTLLRCVPIAAAWDRRTSAGAHCMPWDTFTTFTVINNVINASTNLILVLLIVPIACSPSASLKNRAMVTAVACIGFVACAAAITRTKLLFNIWQNGHNTNKLVANLHIWSTIELTTALLATNLPTLPTISPSLNPTILPTHHHHPTISSPRLHNPPTPTPTPSTHSRYSSQTVIYRPNTAYHPTPTRFHDAESNLTFDIESQSQHSSSRTHTARAQTQTQTCSRTHSVRSRDTGHGRNVSDWSQFSGFTYSTELSEALDVRGEGEEGLGVEKIGVGLGRGDEGVGDVRGEWGDGEERCRGGGGEDAEGVDIGLAKTRKR